MMRLARRASLLVAFFLLTSTATAHAECAWVLWIEWALDRRDVPAHLATGIIPLEAATTKAECERALAARHQQQRVKATSTASPTPSTRAGRRGSERRGEVARAVRPDGSVGETATALSA
jgi:hypothetical protein